MARPTEAAGLLRRSGRAQEKIGYKIREAQLQKIPYMLVVAIKKAPRVRCRCAAAGGDLGPDTVADVRPRRGWKRPRRKDPVEPKRVPDDVTNPVADKYSRAFIAFDRSPRRDDRALQRSASASVKSGHRRYRRAARHHCRRHKPSPSGRRRARPGRDLATAVPPVCRIMDLRQVPVPGAEAAREARKHLR